MTLKELINKKSPVIYRVSKMTGLSENVIRNMKKSNNCELKTFKKLADKLSFTDEEIIKIIKS